MDSNDIYNTVHTHLLQHQISEHHLNRYINFLKYCSTQPHDRSDYFEKHHILPTSLFPQYKRLSDAPWNQIKLTAREHYIAHWLLAKTFNCPEMWYAFMCMNNFTKNGNRDYQNSYLYEKGRLNVSLMRKQFKHSEQTKEKMSKTRKGVLKSDNHKMAIKLAHLKHDIHPFTGRVHSEETKEKMSKSSSGKLNPNYGKSHSSETKLKMSKAHNKIYTCPHCKKSGGRGLLKYHFDNCFMVDVTKNVFVGISPSKEKFLFGSIERFCVEYNLSPTLVERFMDTKTPCYVNNKKCGIKGDNTVGWIFEKIR